MDVRRTIDIEEVKAPAAYAWRIEVLFLAALHLLVNLTEADMAKGRKKRAASGLDSERFDACLIAASGFFDTDYYVSVNADVAMAKIDPLDHYLRHGGVEGRRPSPLFDGAAYLTHNSDVRAAGVNPLVHYIVFGIVEGRTLGAPLAHPVPRVIADYKRFNRFVSPEAGAFAAVADLCSRHRTLQQASKREEEAVGALHADLDVLKTKLYRTSAAHQRALARNDHLMRELAALEREADVLKADSLRFGSI